MEAGAYQAGMDHGRDWLWGEVHYENESDGGDRVHDARERGPV